MFSCDVEIGRFCIFRCRLPCLRPSNAGEKLARQEFDLEQRLLDYSARIIRWVESLPNTRATNHVGGQLLRSGTSPCLNHGEAQAAESINDFVHKMRICLKELSGVTSLPKRLIKAIPMIKPPSKVDPLLSETEELIKIFFASIKTSENNRARRQK